MGMIGGLIIAGVLMISGGFFGPLGAMIGGTMGVLILVLSLGGAVVTTIGGILGGVVR
ncbi:MAG: hypothetical protein ACOCTL_03095 [Candidatus Hadarchaeota archaeon]